MAIIDGALNGINMAAYVRTDWPILQALTRAAGRGVHIHLDGGRRTSIKVKRKGSDLMHLKNPAERPGHFVLE